MYYLLHLLDVCFKYMFCEWPANSLAGQGQLGRAGAQAPQTRVRKRKKMTIATNTTTTNTNTNAYYRYQVHYHQKEKQCNFISPDEEKPDKIPNVHEGHIFDLAEIIKKMLMVLFQQR